MYILTVNVDIKMFVKKINKRLIWRPRTTEKIMEKESKDQRNIPVFEQPYADRMTQQTAYSLGFKISVKSLSKY